MEKLKIVIQNYGRWAGLEKSCTQIETFLDSSFPIAIEGSKALIESICKTILKEQKIEFSSSTNTQQLMTKTVDILAFTKYSDQLKQFGRSFINIIKNLAEIRNDIALISHGAIVDELHRPKIDQISTSFLLNSIETIACFLIEYYELEFTKRLAKEAEKAPEYNDFDEFNLYFDETCGNVTIAEYQYSSSEVLFNLDLTAYKTEYQKYLENLNEIDRK